MLSHRKKSISEGIVSQNLALETNDIEKLILPRLSTEFVLKQSLFSKFKLCPTNQFYTAVQFDFHLLSLKNIFLRLLTLSCLEMGF